jgi:hypothetical protein
MYVWFGGSTGGNGFANWSDLNNWEGQAAPSNQDPDVNLQFPADAFSLTSNNDIPGLNVHTLTFTPPVEGLPGSYHLTGSGFNLGAVAGPGTLQIDSGVSTRATTLLTETIDNPITVTQGPGTVNALDPLVPLALNGALDLQGFGLDVNTAGGAGAPVTLAGGGHRHGRRRPDRGRRRHAAALRQFRQHLRGHHHGQRRDAAAAEGPGGDRGARGAGDRGRRGRAGAAERADRRHRGGDGQRLRPPEPGRS